MHNNVLNELILVEQYYEEYLSLINTYQNFNRQSVFCRYYNINRSFTTYAPGLDATYDYYDSGISYDMYEYTPMFYASQVVNDSQDQVDLQGPMFLGNLNVIIYTIDEPSINDLLTFPYAPNTAPEIFKVTNIRVPINAKTSTQKLKWYELTLETAPIKDVNKLKINNRWVYSLNLQKYMMYHDFERMVKEFQILENSFKGINEQFDQKTELFYFHDSVTGQKVAPLAENAVIFDLIATVKEYFREFDTSWIPFGIEKYGVEGNLDIVSGQKIDYLYHGAQLYDGGYDAKLGKIIVTTPDSSKLNILNYDGEPNVYDLARLLNTWVWRNQIPYKSQYTEFIDDRFIHAGYDEELEVAEYDPDITCVDDKET